MISVCRSLSLGEPCKPDFRGRAVITQLGMDESCSHAFAFQLFQSKTELSCLPSEDMIDVEHLKADELSLLADKTRMPTGPAADHLLFISSR